MTNNPIVPEIKIDEIDEHTPSGLYNVEGFGFQFIEQLHYTVNNEPVHRTNLRSVINVQTLKDLMRRVEVAEDERDYYMQRAVKLRGELNAINDKYENGVNGLPHEARRYDHRGRPDD